MQKRFLLKSLQSNLISLQNQQSKVLCYTPNYLMNQNLHLSLLSSVKTQLKNYNAQLVVAVNRDRLKNKL